MTIVAVRLMGCAVLGAALRGGQHTGCWSRSSELCRARRTAGGARPCSGESLGYRFIIVRIMGGVADRCLFTRSSSTGQLLHGKRMRVAQHVLEVDGKVNTEQVSDAPRLP